VTTGAIDIKPMLEFLDTVFDVTASTIDMFVDMLRRAFDVGDDETGIFLRLTAGM
jgi:hypothetical protein